MTAPVKELLALAASEALMREIAPDLRIGAAVPRAAARPAAVDDRASMRVGLARDGVATVRDAGDAALCATLARAIEALEARELPACFVYAFDEPWAIGDALRAEISALVGSDYVLVEDVWAWQIAPGRGGWPPHRGSSVLLAREAPEILNVWVALSDVTTDRACIHAVPLDEDPGYPGALARQEAPLEAVRALPLRAGEALFWNANVLHWGGRCAARAEGPRVSCSFTLCRHDALDRFAELTPLHALDGLELSARMDVLARMILVYGAGQPDVSPAVRDWAAITHALSTRFGHAAGSAALRKAP